jgi:hypothetical protein
MGKIIFFVIFGFKFSSFAQANETSWTWVQNTKGKSTNSVVSKEFKIFLRAELPTFKLDLGFKKKNKKSNLSEALLNVLSGPSNQTVSPNDHSIVLSACRFQSCDEKGLYWADATTKTSVMAIVHYIYDGKFDKSPQLFIASKNFKCESINHEAIAQIKEWLSKETVNPARTRCLNDGKVIEIQI